MSKHKVITKTVWKKMTLDEKKIAVMLKIGSPVYIDGELFMMAGKAQFEAIREFDDEMNLKYGPDRN